MTSVGAITPNATSSTTGTSSTTSTSSANGTSDTTSTDNTQLSSQAFLQLMVAQLQYQDPTKPADTNTFMQETATLNQVESTTANTTNIASMLQAQQAQTASSLVGKTVTYATDGTSATGVVSAATISSTPPMLRIDNMDVALSAIQQVQGSASAS